MPTRCDPCPVSKAGRPCQLTQCHPVAGLWVQFWICVSVRCVFGGSTACTIRCLEHLAGRRLVVACGGGASL